MPATWPPCTTGKRFFHSNNASVESWESCNESVSVTSNEDARDSGALPAWTGDVFKMWRILKLLSDRDWENRGSCRWSTRFGAIPYRCVEVSRSGPDFGIRGIWKTHFCGITNTQDPASIAAKELLQVDLRQSNFVNQGERGCRIPARIVGTIHHPINAVIFDREFYSHAVRRNGVGIHPADIRAGRTR